MLHSDFIESNVFKTHRTRKLSDFIFQRKSNSNDLEEESFLLLRQFCMESSLHGLRYIGQPKRHIVERIFWGISFLIAVGVAIFSIAEVWDRYRTTPVITVFQDKETTIDLISFPAITICNTNNVIKTKAHEFISRWNRNPMNQSANDDLYLLDHICQTSTSFSEMFNFSLDRGIKQNVRQQIHDFRHPPNQTSSSRYLKNAPTPKTASGRRIYHLLRDVAQSCNDMILRCVWNDEIWRCDDLFDEVETDFGYCCVFNMVPASLLLTLRNDTRDKEETVKEWAKLNLNTDKLILNNGDNPKPKFPYRQNSHGKSSGLSVLLDPDLESYFCTNTDSAGFMALAHLPLDFPRLADDGIAIRPNTETFLKIRPELTVAEEEIRNYEFSKRNCYFGNEYPLKFYKFYTSANCEDECIANITFSRCQCVRYFMPRDDKTAICGASKFNCSERVRKELLKNGIRRLCKSCRPTCTEINYFMTTSNMPLRMDVPLWESANGTNAFWSHKNVSILHVHFSVDATYPKLRKKLYGFIDLLSNTGGLLGLCLGFSVLSLLEIVYFATLRLYCQTRKGKIMGERINETAKLSWNKVYNAMAKKFRRENTTHFNIEPWINVDGMTSNKSLSAAMKSSINPAELFIQRQLYLETLPHYIHNA